jgi:hypothetical protein
VRRRAGIHGPLALDPLDPDTTQRMMRGVVHPDDAPPGYARVAALLRLLRSPATTDGGAERTIRMMAAVIRVSDPRRRPES